MRFHSALLYEHSAFNSCFNKLEFCSGSFLSNSSRLNIITRTYTSSRQTSWYSVNIHYIYWHTDLSSKARKSVWG